MGSLVSLFLCIFFLFFNLNEAIEPNRILFLAQSGHLKEAFEGYEIYHKEKGKHDRELLQQIGLLIIEQGYYSDDEECQLLAIFGAGISMNEKVLPLLLVGMKNSKPQLQLACLQAAARFHDDVADATIKEALRSNYALIRLEGLLQLAQKKMPDAMGQAEALMYKLSDEGTIFFPRIFACIGTPEATKALRKLLIHSNEKVRIEAIINIAKYERDDLLPAIRILSTQHAIGHQEAAAYAFSFFRDHASLPLLYTLAKRESPTIRLAALKALYDLGKTETRIVVESLAKDNNLFAISTLGDMKGSEDTLFLLLKSQDVQIRTNAVISLLKLQDPRCLNDLSGLLLSDFCLTKINSPGKTLIHFKVTPSCGLENKQKEKSDEIKQAVLELAKNLPEREFLILSRKILESKAHELIPITIQGLNELQSKASLALLKEFSQRPGAPFVRNYCNLALYKLHEEGPYEKILSRWTIESCHDEFIKLHEVSEEHEDAFSLSPKEKSHLLIETLIALTERQEDLGIDTLINAMRYGHKKNCYALAGLLIRAVH